VILLNLLIKPIWLLLENIVQNDIGHEQYGTYSALLSLSFLFISFADFGINYYITQKGSSGQGELRVLFSHMLTFKLMLLIAYPMLLTGVGLLLNYSARELYFLALLSFTQALLQFVYFFRANFQASQHFVIDSFISVLDKVLLIIIVLVIMSYGLTLHNFINGRLITVLLTFCIVYLLILKTYGWVEPSLDFTAIKRILILSWPFALMTALYSVNEKIDQVMLERIYGPKEAGLYAGAYRWLDAFMMYLWTIMPIFFAKFAFNINNKDESNKLFNSGLIICALPFIFLFSFIIFYGDKFFILFSNSDMQEIAVMSTTLKILIVSALLNGFFSMFSTLINSTGFVKPMSMAVVISILLNVALNFIFIPKYGAIAAAVNTCVSTAFLSVVAVWMVKAKEMVEVSYGIIIRLLIILGLTFLTFFGFSYLSVQWISASVCAAIVMVTAGFLLGLKKYII
jgi:O-antigen/teichoic acid export membrane protein